MVDANLRKKCVIFYTPKLIAKLVPRSQGIPAAGYVFYFHLLYVVLPEKQQYKLKTNQSAQNTRRYTNAHSMVLYILWCKHWYQNAFQGHVHKYDYQNVTLEKVAIVTELSTASIVLSVAQ